MRDLTGRAVTAASSYLGQLGMTSVEDLGGMLLAATDDSHRVLVGVFVSDGVSEADGVMVRAMERALERNPGFERADAVYLGVRTEDRATVLYRRDLVPRHGGTETC